MQSVSRESVARAIRGLGGFVPGDRVWVMVWGEPHETRVDHVEGDVVHTGIGSYRRRCVLGSPVAEKEEVNVQER